MASMKLSSFALVLLLSGLVVFGEIGRAAACDVQCVQGGHITCDNYPGKELDGCHCDCAPKNGKNCVLHLNNDKSSSTNCTVHTQRLD